MAKSDDSSITEKNDSNFESQNNSKKGNSLRKNITTISVCALTLVIILLLITIIILLQHTHIPVTVNILSQTTSPQNGSQLDTKQQITVLTNNSTILPFVFRPEWLAVSPTHPLDLLYLPVSLIIIHHTATENCTTKIQCIYYVRQIQTYHVDIRHWNDIGYNFLIGGDGVVYEGRGWKYQGAHTYGYNSKSLGIAFIGNFNTAKPTEAQIVACQKLIKKGVEFGNIQKNYKLLGAKQVTATNSPGLALFEEITKWDHWAPVP